MSDFNRRIAIITPFYTPAKLSGSSLLNKQIAELLKENGFQVTVITSNAYWVRYWKDLLFNRTIKPKDIEENGIRIIRLKHHHLISSITYLLSHYLNFILPKQVRAKFEIMHYGPFLDQKELASQINKNNFDIVYSSTLPLFLNFQLVDIISKLNKKPTFIFRPDFHVALPVFHNYLLQSILKRADLIQVFTKSEKKALMRTFNIKENKVKIIPAAIKIKNTHISTKEVLDFKKKYKLGGKKIVLFVGERNYHKGALFLLKTMRNLFKEDQSYILLSIGLSKKEWFLEKMFGERSFLIDLGYVSEKNKQIAFQVSNIFCLPSISESFGIVYLEAWLQKKPVIGVKIPAIRELIENNKGGVCVEFNNELELKNAINLLTNNKSLARLYGLNGYRALKNKYNFNNLKTIYLKMFR